MYDESFIFAGVDMRQRFGLICEAVQDSLAPALRPRLTTIPNRSGEYDHGAVAYDSRTVTVICGTVMPITEATRREISLFLSKKGSLRTYREPDKYYIGRLYAATPLEWVGGDLLRLQLDFTCDPFAYGDPIEIDVKSGSNLINYPGTAPAGFRLSLTNTSGVDVAGLMVKVVTKL